MKGLTEIRSSRKVDEEALLVQRGDARRIKDVKTQPSATPAPRPQTTQQRDPHTSDEVLAILKDDPDQSTLRVVLDRISATTDDTALNLRIPGPYQAKIIHVLVENTIPTLWHALDESDRILLAKCFTNVAALNAVLAKLRQLVTPVKATDAITTQIIELLELLSIILRPSYVVEKIWSGLRPIQSNTTKHTLAWKEVVTLFGSGRLISIPAEAYDYIKHDNRMKAVSALSSFQYVEWLANNLCSLALGGVTGGDVLQAGSRLLSKCFSLGHSTILVEKLILSALEQDAAPRMTAMTAQLPTLTKKTYLETTLSWLSTKFPGTPQHTEHLTTAAGIAALLDLLTKDDAQMRRHLATILLDPNAAAIISLPVRWAMSKTLFIQPDFDFASIIENSISMFADQLSIDHSPAAMQEAIALNILISTTIQSSKGSTALSIVLRSTAHMQAVSNRLASSNTRARWLGMIVGTALSKLTDKPGAQMNFGTSDMETDEAKAWLAMLDVKSKMGEPKDLLQAIQRADDSKKITKTHTKTQELPLINGKQTFGPPRPPELLHQLTANNRVTELDDTVDPDDDLKPYAKPDSDPEDSDEDATLVTRNKPRPPVYIRTLMSMLRETENADKFQLGINHAAPLIRRKIGFGREVTDHAEELARILTNLQDPFDTEDFDDLRLQALIAIVLSDVDDIAPWMARQAFIKDYSIAQRAIILTALGLSGRELAGLKHEDRLNKAFDNTALASKRLPSNMHAIYAPRTAAIDSTAKMVEQSMIQPLALAAADQTTSHLDAVKVRKFSSRLAVERTKRKPTANALARIFSRAYFYPLLSALQHDMALHGDSSVCLSTPMVLTTFLKTLAVLLHAAGPAAVDQAAAIADFWELLLSLRIKAINDISIMEAILFSLLTILESSYDKQSLIQNTPKQLMETKEWAEVVFEKTGGGNLIEGEGEEARIRMLCAGVLTKINAIITDYQGQLLGGLT